MNIIAQAMGDYLPYMISDADHFETLDHYLVEDYTFTEILHSFIIEDRICKVIPGGIWTFVYPDNLPIPLQGWKIHLSTAYKQAPEVLRAVIPLLLTFKTSFKFASSPKLVHWINHPHWPRGMSGKFMTVYPTDDEGFKKLVVALHKATSSYNGPRILSDKRYQQGSLVHYRYGGFKRRTKLDDGGNSYSIIVGPDGKDYIDARTPYYSPPPWVIDPFAPSMPFNKSKKGVATKSDMSARDKSLLLLNRRFKVKSVLRHANRGGLYVAEDLDNKCDVVIKEARPYVGSDEEERDMVYRLHKEARILNLLSDTCCVPDVVQVFEQGTHWFLAQTLIAGMTLREYVNRAFSQSHGRSGFQAEELARIFTTVCDLMKSAHDQAVILRDFNPNNIIIREADNAFFLIDFELSYDGLEQTGINGGTPAYQAPEQIISEQPIPAHDYFSLGATLFFIMTNRDPLMLPDARPISERYSEYLKHFSLDCGLPNVFHAVIVKCVSTDPRDRYSPMDVQRELNSFGYDI
jgi:tRNA A-37 threonylcarbamoyl transferase component Bud32